VPGASRHFLGAYTIATFSSMPFHWVRPTLYTSPSPEYASPFRPTDLTCSRESRGQRQAVNRQGAAPTPLVRWRSQVSPQRWAACATADCWSAPSQWHYAALVGSTAEPEFGDVLDDFGNLPGGVDAAIYTENTFVPDAERIGRQHVR
jgi:hypothetical protein